MNIIDINEYKKNMEEENKYEPTNIDGIDLEAALGSVLWGDAPENKLQERYNDNELERLRERVRDMRIPTEKDVERIFENMK